jgi:oxygen-independent coproporphyrinogen-3 oxidase
MQFLSLYLHIPFCNHRCTYCAFNIYTDMMSLADAYLTALEREMAVLSQGAAVHTIYLGGGTPSLLTLTQLSTLMHHLHTRFTIVLDAEVTFELNPENAGLDYLRGVRQLGINRLSIGMQSAHDSELSLFGRSHTTQDTRRAFEIARQAGFENISLDLIYGVPNQTLAMWVQTLDAALHLQPDHFSIYSLQVESGTEIFRRIRQGNIPEPDDDLAADMYDMAMDKLVDYPHYEISSWGKASRHNLQYWHNQPYLGLGAGAHSCANQNRTVNVMRPEVYIERITQDDGSLPYPRTAATQSYEVIERDEAIFETVMLGLRLLDEGLSLQVYQQRYGEPITQRYGAVIQKLKQQAMIEERDDHLFLTPRAYLISNRVFEAFMPETI